MASAAVIEWWQAPNSGSSRNKVAAAAIEWRQLRQAPKNVSRHYKVAATFIEWRLQVL